MSREEQTLLQELKTTAKMVVPSGGQVWLFGSRARGEAKNDSDWDLLILVDKESVNSNDEDNISYPFVEAGWHHASAVNPLLYTYKEWEKRSLTQFHKNVEQDKIRIL
ncbi:MAG: nucleotidyltransferase domain-containing protein [Bacteroidaceae bacterium]|nr:nucleotidyltransferase domain-containing protein [Bacteroidaceae bacterium]